MARTDGRAGVPIGMHRPWRDFCVYRRTFTPSSSGANVLARLQKRDSFFPRPLCLPFRLPRPFRLSLPASVPGPFFLRSSFQAHSRLKLAGNRPPHPRNPLPGAEFLRLRLRQDTGPDNGPLPAPSVRNEFRETRLGVSKFLEIFSRSSLQRAYLYLRTDVGFLKDFKILDLTGLIVVV